MITSSGILHYSDDEYRLVLKVEQDLSDYYRAMIPLYNRAYKQGWPAHLTVIRPEFDIPSKIEYWGRYEGEVVDFVYSPYIEWGKGFYWFNAWSKRLEIVREELGLINISKFALKPEGYNKTFHCTIAKYNDISNSGEAPEK
jgi:hypothetical protein